MKKFTCLLSRYDTLIKKIITIVRVPKKVFIPRNEDDDFEKNENSDFSCLVGMKLDKSYVKVRFPTFQ